MEAIALDPVDAVTVTTLVDNVTDALLADSGPAKRAPIELAATGARACVPSTGSRPRRRDEGRAEHADPVRHGHHRGRAGREHAPARAVARRHRDRRAEPRPLGPHDGHARPRRPRSAARSCPCCMHPEFWTRRRVAIPGREPIELPSTSRSALEGAGFEIVEQRAAVVPARRVAAGDGRGRPHDRLRARLPRPSGAPRRRLGARPADPRRPGARRRTCAAAASSS